MTNEVQRFDIAGSPGSGKFTLAFNGSEPTAPIAYHPTPSVVQSALEALSTIGLGNVVVAKDGNWGYLVAFADALGDQDLPLLVADDSQLGGGGTITVSEVTPGAPDGGGGDSGGGVLMLQTPCTALELQRFAVEVAAVCSGAHRQFPVTTTDSQISVG